VFQRWCNLIEATNIPRKATRSITLPIAWEIWLESNAKIFNRRESSVPTIVGKIKNEVSAWIAAGAKGLATLTATL
jgi:hypothetical protein